MNLTGLTSRSKQSWFLQEAAGEHLFPASSSFQRLPCYLLAHSHIASTSSVFTSPSLSHLLSPVIPSGPPG